MHSPLWTLEGREATVAAAILLGDMAAEGGLDRFSLENMQRLRSRENDTKLRRAGDSFTLEVAGQKIHRIRVAVDQPRPILAHRTRV